MVTLSTSLDVRLLRDADSEAWDDFVRAHPSGSPFHLTAWKTTIEDSFGYTPHYLMAFDGTGPRGVLPLFEVKNMIIGRVLLSTPFAVYGGILADTPEVRQKLYDSARDLGRELACDYIEFRNAVPEQCGGIPNVSRYVSFSQPVVSGVEATLQSLPKKTRNLVRKAMKQPFRMEYGVRDLKNFEALYATSMRRLGTPCFPGHYFQNLLKNFGEAVDVRETWLNGQLMAASLNFLFRGDMHIYYAASDTRFNALGPNTYMYFDHLCWAGENGFQTFDFGRCKRDTGVFEFKRHWNTTMRELPYEIVLLNRKQLPNFSPANPKFKTAIQLWQKVPLRTTRYLGPHLIKFFP